MWKLFHLPVSFCLLRVVNKKALEFRRILCKKFITFYDQDTNRTVTSESSKKKIWHGWEIKFYRWHAGTELKTTMHKISFGCCKPIYFQWNEEQGYHRAASDANSVAASLVHPYGAPNTLPLNQQVKSLINVLEANIMCYELVQLQLLYYRQKMNGSRSQKSMPTVLDLNGKIKWHSDWYVWSWPCSGTYRRR